MTERSLTESRVVKTVTVPLPPEAAFSLFTDRIAEWWPLHTHSVAADTYGGRLTVTSSASGTEICWTAPLAR